MGDQQEEPICDSSLVDANDVNATLNVNVPLSGNVAPNCNVVTSANVAQTSSVEKYMINSDSVTQTQPFSSQSENNTVNTSFTAENITESYMRSVKLATAFTPEVREPLCEDYQPVSVNNGISSGIVPVQIPAFTPTPIASRQDQSASSGAESHSIYSIIRKIDRLESGTKAIKNDILHQMECKLNELKTSVVCMIENLGTNRTYADGSKSTSSVQASVVEQPSMGNDNNSLCASYVDEGYGDQSGTSVNGSSSQTQLKTPYVPDSTDNQQRTMTNPTPQPIPVRMTNRNTPTQRNPANNMFDDVSHKNPIRGNAAAYQKRTLIIGDSILKGINTRGLKNGIKICARGSGKIGDMWEEISVYDLTSFAHVIICVGGNDSSSKVNIKAFEESYDQLISFIKSAIKDCAVYLSKIIPRGDTDVTEFNNSFQRLSDHWKEHQVKCIENTSKMFFYRNGMPSARYYSHHGIHLSRSGIKRLVDALNRHIYIVTDINLCVFKGSNFHDKRNARPGTNFSRNYNEQSGQGNRGWGFNGQWMNDNRGCYGCAMPGHNFADCWYSQ